MEKKLIRVVTSCGWSKAGEVYTAISGETNYGYAAWFPIGSDSHSLLDENNDTYYIRRENAETLPGWDDYPDWAQWRAVDRNGSLWCYSEEPIQGQDNCAVWGGSGGRHKRITQLIPAAREMFKCPNWKDTLEERPEREVKQEFIDTNKAVSWHGAEWIVTSTQMQYTTSGPKAMADLSRVRSDGTVERVQGIDMKELSRIKGPYIHSFDLLGNRIVCKPFDESQHYQLPNIFELLFGGTKQKEENEMDCPRSKELTPIERVEAKLDKVRDDLAVHVAAEQVRIIKLDELYIAIKDHSEKAFEGEIVATLLREADQV